jgi:transposase
MKYITMTNKENERLKVINNLLGGNINGTEASYKLGLTIRHIRRLKARVKKDGAVGIVHQGRGKESNNKLNKEKTATIVSLIKKYYVDFKPTLANEQLLKKHNIKLSTETLRQIMIKNGIWKVKLRKKNKKHREWRPRKEMCGIMQQYDGSYHKWLEGRAEEMCLLLSVDDATGKITHAKFDYHEGVFPTFGFWKEYIEKNGKPRSIYLDKFSTYKINHKNAVDNNELITQFQRACMDLDIRLIVAHSPEAKGRVERMFQTLQDRLVKEMRLAKINTIKQANKFLTEYIPKFNAKFAVVPSKRGNAHRELSKIDKNSLNIIFSRQEKRVVMNDYTIRFENKYFQLKQKQPTTVYKKDKVIVLQQIDGSISLMLNGKKLNYVLLPKRPEKEINIKLPAITKNKTAYIPPANHPWRHQILLDKLKTQKLKIGHF